MPVSIQGSATTVFGFSGSEQAGGVVRAAVRIRGAEPVPRGARWGQTGDMGVIALVVTLVAVLAAAGHGAYLAMLTSAARKRPGGEPVVEFARGRMPV